MDLQWPHTVQSRISNRIENRHDHYIPLMTKLPNFDPLYLGRLDNFQWFDTEYITGIPSIADCKWAFVHNVCVCILGKQNTKIKLSITFGFQQLLWPSGDHFNP